MPDKIEILPVTLLDEERPTVDDLKRIARSLSLEFGWHYLLDLTWIIRQLGCTDGKRIMDAGAGTGVMQWYLAEHGAEVLSVDRASRADLPLRFRRRFRTRGLREQDLLPTGQMLQARMLAPGRLRTKITSQARDLAAALQGNQASRQGCCLQPGLKKADRYPRQLTGCGRRRICPGTQLTPRPGAGGR